MELLPIDWFEADFYGSKVARKGMTVCVFNSYIRSADDLDDLEQDAFSVAGLNVQSMFLLLFFLKNY